MKSHIACFKYLFMLDAVELKQPKTAKLTSIMACFVIGMSVMIPSVRMSRTK